MSETERCRGMAMLNLERRSSWQRTYWAWVISLILKRYNHHRMEIFCCLIPRIWFCTKCDAKMNSRMESKYSSTCSRSKFSLKYVVGDGLRGFKCSSKIVLFKNTLIIFLKIYIFNISY
jgi:hypothetical protein